MIAHGKSPYTHCKDCGTEIVWVGTQKGRKMPIHRKQIDGRDASASDLFDSKIHVAHWSSCPGADKRRAAKPGPAVAAPVERGGPRLFAITLAQPWPWAISWAGCDFAPCRSHNGLRPGDWLAIHADRHMYSESAERWLTHEMAQQPPMRDALPVAHIACIGEVVRRIEEGESQDPWHRGQAGYVLRKLRVLQDVTMDEDMQPGIVWIPSEVLRGRIRAAAKRQEQRR